MKDINNSIQAPILHIMRMIDVNNAQIKPITSSQASTHVF